MDVETAKKVDAAQEVHVLHHVSSCEERKATSFAANRKAGEMPEAYVVFLQLRLNLI